MVNHNEVLTAALLFFLGGSISAQPIDTIVKTALVKELEAKNVPGGVAGVFDGTTVTSVVAAGVANEETGTPVTPDMLFRLGSTTKMFVALATLLAVDEGILSLDSPVGTYLPDLPDNLKEVTLQQVLTHTAGIQDEAPMDGPDDDDALAREIAGWTPERRFLMPGEAFSYSNPGYWLVGRVLEAVERRPFADVIWRRVLRPLGMHHSTFRPKEAHRFPVASPHDRVKELVAPEPNHAGTWPSGSLYSSVPELLRFASAILNDGILEGVRVFPSAVIRIFLTSQVQIEARPGVTYGYGLMHQSYRGLRTVFHTGARTGYGSIIDLAPDRKIAVVVLGNRTGALLTSTVRAGYASRTTLGPLEEEDFSGGNYVTDPAMMAPYIGMYVNKAPIELEIYNRSALPLVRIGEILTLRKGQERIPLRILNDSTATNGFQWLTFTRTPDGVIRLLHYDMYTLRRSTMK